MNSAIVHVRVPGKLLLFGEYAILEPGSQALILSINRWLELQVYLAAEGITVESDAWPGICWYSPSPGVPLAAEAAPSLPFVDSALRLAAQWLQETHLPFQPLKLVLRSELHQHGRKLGLGSSAALTVAILAGVLAAHGQVLDSWAERLKLFKLAVLAHGQTQGGGSGADLAGCIFGSVTCYRRFDPDWLANTSLSLERLLSMDWPFLGLEKLPWPESCGLLVAWTGISAATVDYIEAFAQVKQDVPEAYQRFLFSANATTMAARDALCRGQYASLAALMRQYRRLLQELQQYFFEPIEPPALKARLDQAEACGCAAKSSGAGGGDCVLGLGDPQALLQLAASWHKQGLIPLEVAPESQGLVYVHC